MSLENQPIRKYFVAGMPPGPTGTGRLIEALLPGLIELGFTVFFPQPDRAFTEREKQVLLSIVSSRVILFHPQSIGFQVAQSLITQNDIGYFVLDNSFFCVKSYNYRGGWNECLDCVGAPSRRHQSCLPFPTAVSLEENQAWLHFLQDTSERILFFCQNYQQAALVRSHFGPRTHIQVVGMQTDEFEDHRENLSDHSPQFDVVFHGSTALAKGWHFALELALYSPQFSFLFPFDFQEIQPLLPNFTIPAHITFHPMTWDTGLKLAVQRSKLVMCPSIWSAPIEGALLKSLYFNGNVAVINTQYGFHCEISPELIHRLEPLPQRAAQQLPDIVQGHTEIRRKAQQWVQEHLQSSCILSKFSEFGTPS